MRRARICEGRTLAAPMPTPETASAPPARRRRRLVAATTAAIGTALLVATLRVPKGSIWFTVTGLLLAATWTIGAGLSGPLPLGRVAVAPRRRALLAAALLGAALFGGFVVASIVGRHLPISSGALRRVLARADAGTSVTVLIVAVTNGAAEELFFRGAVYDAVGPSRPELLTTLGYVVVTAASGNPALVVAALVMGAVFALERRASGGVLASIVTHVTWSTLMLRFLPR